MTKEYIRENYDNILKIDRAGIVKDCTALRQMIIDNPDLPIVFSVSTEDYYDDYAFAYINENNVSCEVGEMLDCDVDWNNNIMFTDRGDFEESLENYLMTDYEIEHLSDSDFEDVLNYHIEKFEPFWKKCILVTIQ